MQQVAILSVHIKYPLMTTHLLPYRVVTKETADLSKGHRSFSPRVLPARKVLDAQTVQVALIQLSVVARDKINKRGSFKYEFPTTSLCIN